jgi:hypothetical protein
MVQTIGENRCRGKFASSTQSDHPRLASSKSGNGQITQQLELLQAVDNKYIPDDLGVPNNVKLQNDLTEYLKPLLSYI